MVLKYSLFRIHTNFKTINNVLGRREKKPPNFLTILFGVTPPIWCYPILRYSCGHGAQINSGDRTCNLRSLFAGLLLLLYTTFYGIWKLFYDTCWALCRRSCFFGYTAEKSHHLKARIISKDLLF
jgi:hypothetical protein